MIPIVCQIHVVGLIERVYRPYNISSDKYKEIDDYISEVRNQLLVASG